MRKVVAGVVGAAAALGAAGCNTLGGGPDPQNWDSPYGWEAPRAPTLTIQEPAEVQFYHSDPAVRLAYEHFQRGDFGLAERHFREAVEKSPRDAAAWVGLAASYDRLRRFDLADKAYAAALRLTGRNAQILNNQGYSYVLRGDLRRARAKFLEADKLDPGNPTIANNLALLDTSYRFIQRTPN